MPRLVKRSQPMHKALYCSRTLLRLQIGRNIIIQQFEQVVSILYLSFTRLRIAHVYSFINSTLVVGDPKCHADGHSATQVVTAEEVMR